MPTPDFIRSFCTFLAHWFPVDYTTYIRSKRWKSKSNAAKKRAGWRCQTCNRPHGQVRLEGHHRTYERLGYEIPEDITVLCDDCHCAVTVVIRKTRHREVSFSAPRPVR
jgi:hypothetical protein